MSRVCRPGGCEKDRVRSCRQADGIQTEGGIWGKVRGLSIVMSTHAARAQIWLFSVWQASDFSPPTAARIRGLYHTHAHCQSSGKTLKLSWGGIHQVPSHNLLHLWKQNKQTCSLLLVLFISKLASLVVYLRNKLAGTRKLPELPSRKPPLLPNGGLVYWTGKGKKQTKHNCSQFTHICASSGLCTPTCLAKSLIWNYSMGTKSTNKKQPQCVSSFLKDTNKHCSESIGSPNWHKDLTWELT